MSESRYQYRIQPVDPDHATGAIRQLLAEIRTHGPAIAVVEWHPTMSEGLAQLLANVPGR
jgi:hypothetical protein